MYSYDTNDYQSTKPRIFNGLTSWKAFLCSFGIPAIHSKIRQQTKPSVFQRHNQVPGNCIICLYSQLPIVSPNSVYTQRLILNLRHVIFFLLKRKLKFEGTTWTSSHIPESTITSDADTKKRQG